MTPYKLMLLLVVMCMISACNPKAIPTVIFPAKEEVAPPPPVVIEEPEPRTAVINVFARDIVNPDVNGRASPVQVRVFIAEDTSVFDGASFETVFDYGDDGISIAPKVITTIRPGAIYSTTFELKPEHKFVVVGAAYQDFGKTQWLEKARLEAVTSQTMNFILSDFSVNYEPQ